MPRDASGNYTLPSGNPVVAGTVITADWANDTMSDMATEMTASLERNAKGAMLAPLGLPDGTVGAPSFRWADEIQTGMFRSGTGEFTMVIAGVKVVRVNAAGLAFWNTSDSAWYSFMDAEALNGSLESQTLITSQTVVPFTNYIAGASLFLSGAAVDRGRLLEGDDYTYNSVTNEVTLATSYTAGTKLTAAFSDPSNALGAAAAAAASAAAAAGSETAAGLSETAAGLSEVAAAASAGSASSSAQEATTRAQEAAEAADRSESAASKPLTYTSSNTTLTPLQRIAVDTSAGAVTITLPGAPTTTYQVELVDYAGTWATNHVTVARNGGKIMGLAEDLILDISSGPASLSWVNTTQGWMLT